MEKKKNIKKTFLQKINSYDRKDWLFFFGVIFLPILTFLGIFGHYPLDVTNDHWIAIEYIEADVQQHYAGWMAFRNTPWAFPLGYTDAINYPNGIIISFTDSIPLAAMFFKLFRAFLPATFQFFGWYSLLCFILQGISAVMLLGLFIKDRWVRLLGMEVFLLTPVMIERAFRHTALTSHFLIIFALYLYFKHKRTDHLISSGYWLLCLLATGIHPYFVPMIAAAYIASAVDYVVNNPKRFYIAIAHFAACGTMVLLFGYAIGTIGFSSGEGGGYGEYGLNLNAIYNAFSNGGIRWSKFLNPVPKNQLDCEAFQYMGIGLLLASAAFIAYYLFCVGRELYAYFTNKKYRESVRFSFNDHYIELAVMCVGLIVFAATNTVYWNDKVVLSYPLPPFGFVEAICDIFRASSRMIWPVIYLAELIVVVWFASYKLHYLLLTLLIAIQIYDFSPAFLWKHEMFTEWTVETKYNETLFADPKWDTLGKSIDLLWGLGKPWYKIPMYAQKYGLKTSITLAARPLDMETKDAPDYIRMLIAGKPIDKNVAFITDKSSEYDIDYIQPKIHKDLRVYDFDDHYIICDKSIFGDDVDFLYYEPHTFVPMDVKETTEPKVLKISLDEENLGLLDTAEYIITDDGRRYEITDRVVDNGINCLIVALDRPDNHLDLIKHIYIKQ